MSTLKPCPFCGGEAKVMDYWPFGVYCTRCAAKVPGFDGKDSIDAWNRRSIDADVVGAVKQAIRDLREEEKGDKTEKGEE